MNTRHNCEGDEDNKGRTGSSCRVNGPEQGGKAEATEELDDSGTLGR
jgi:hypothetical protein